MSVINRARGVAVRWWPVPALVFLGLAGGAGYSIAAPVQYSASAYVVATVTTSVSTPQGDTQLALGFAQAYARITGQGDVLVPAAESTGHTLDWLRSHVQSSSSPNAPIIQITGTDASPADAAAVANAVAKSLAGYGDARSTETRVSVSVFSEALPPDQPATPGLSVDMTVGAAAGGLLGLFSVLSRDPRGEGVPATTLIPAPNAPSDDHVSPSEPAPAPALQPQEEAESSADALEQLFAERES
jgi:capsular polysaccharide biosynthesis protein